MVSAFLSFMTLAPAVLSGFFPILVSASRGKPAYNATAVGAITSHAPTFPASNNFTLASQTTAKRGIVYNRGGDKEASEFTNQNEIGWAYNWAPDHGALAGNVEIVPMLWTLYSRTSSGDQSEWNYYTENNGMSYHVLGYNEPDSGANGGSGISAADAAAAWPTDMESHGEYQSARTKFYLGSPAITAGGMAWMDDFISKCINCEFDFFAVHWYGDCVASEFEGYLTEYKNRYMGAGQPMWVTEYGAINCASPHDEAQFIIDTTNWMEGQGWIERYAYWGNLGTNTYEGSETFLNKDLSWSCQGTAYVTGKNVC